MDHLGILRAVSDREGVPVLDLQRAAQRDRLPVDDAPSLMRMADIVEAWGWALVAVPRDDVPAGALVVGYSDGTPRPSR